VRELASQQQVTLLDVDMAMSGQGRWFGDVCHFNEDGVSRFAQVVAGQLLPEVGVSPLAQ
jgi:hypothetical protein